MELTRTMHFPYPQQLLSQLITIIKKILSTSGTLIFCLHFRLVRYGSLVVIFIIHKSGDKVNVKLKVNQIFRLKSSTYMCTLFF